MQHFSVPTLKDVFWNKEIVIEESQTNKIWEESSIYSLLIKNIKNDETEATKMFIKKSG